MSKALIRRTPVVLQLLPPHEQLEELQQAEERSAFEGQTVIIRLENNYEFMGTVIKISDTHVVTDYGTAKKDQIAYVRVMKSEEVAIRRGLA